jgi:hypothetical protein
MNSFAQLADGDGTLFLLRWRGRQEGPYSGTVVEAKLAAHEIGLQHEIYYEGKWVTLRDYITVRTAALDAEREARVEQERRKTADAERQAQEREDQNRAAALAEERRKNDLLAAGLLRPGSVGPGPVPPSPAILKPHRGGMILTLGLVGLFIFGPLCLAAWIMGSGDLQAMDAGSMDDRGRSITSTGRNIGLLGTVLWIIGAAFFLLAQ